MQIGLRWQTSNDEEESRILRSRGARQERCRQLRASPRLGCCDKIEELCPILDLDSISEDDATSCQPESSVLWMTPDEQTLLAQRSGVDCVIRTI